MGDPVRVRPAKVSDLLVATEILLHGLERLGTIEPEEDDIFVALHERILGEKCLVAEIGGRVVGVATYFVGAPFWNMSARIGHPEVVAVDKDHERMGVSRKLFKERERCLAALGCKMIVAETDVSAKNSGMYETLGYVHTKNHYIKRIS